MKKKAQVENCGLDCEVLKDHWVHDNLGPGELSAVTDSEKTAGNRSKATVF